MRLILPVLSLTFVVGLAGCASGNQASTGSNFGAAVGMMTGIAQPEKPPGYFDKIKNCADGVSRSFPDGEPCPEDKALGITKGGK